MFFAGQFPHKIIEAVFGWVSGGFYGLGLWEVKMVWVRVMGVTLVSVVEHDIKEIFKKSSQIWIVQFSRGYPLDYYAHTLLYHVHVPESDHFDYCYLNLFLRKVYLDKAACCPHQHQQPVFSCVL